MFHIGEIVIYYRPESPHHGKEVEILSGVESVVCCDHISRLKESAQAYVITTVGARSSFWAEPKNLRKKRPDLGT